MLFVSNLVARKADNKVVLSWQNPPAFQDILEVYRGDQVLNSQSALDRATLITELGGDEQEFVDSLPMDGNNFYAVIVRSRVGDVQNLIFVSFKNYTFNPIHFERSSARLTKLKATTESNRVNLAWSYKGSDDYNVDVAVYRSLLPIRSTADLENAIKIANVPIANRMFTDAVVPNINYFYAVIVSDSVKVQLTVGVNTTDKPVFIADNRVKNNFDINTFIPLPLLTFQVDPITGAPIDDPFVQRLPKMTPLSKIASASHRDFENGNPDVMQYLYTYRFSDLFEKDVVILPDEKYYTPTEFDIPYKLALKLIRDKNYLEALTALRNLSSESLNVSMRDRILYYYGVVLFKQRDFNNAFINLNLASNTFLTESRPYLTAIAYEIYKTLEK